MRIYDKLNLLALKVLGAGSVYEQGYRANLETIRRSLETVENIQTLVRNRMHRYIRILSAF